VVYRRSTAARAVHQGINGQDPPALLVKVFPQLFCKNTPGLFNITTIPFHRLKPLHLGPFFCVYAHELLLFSASRPIRDQRLRSQLSRESTLTVTVKPSHLWSFCIKTPVVSNITKEPFHHTKTLQPGPCFFCLSP
jgi:hypothetical protein